mmetsp:Transcript_25040/g.38852  ORF Transcript_25040/g.38852 Transcript_25040/m.38852 type:complete len:148 (+) Transcript_25040:3305-3748(+)
MLVLLFMLWFYAVFQFVRDFIETERRPVFYSSTIFPIYKLNPQTNHIEPHYDPTVAWIIGLILLIGWGFFTNLHISPVWFGAVLVMCVELLILLSLIYLRSITLDSLKNATEFMDKQNVKKAWIASKMQYFKGKGAFSRLELLSYRR